MNVCVVQKAYQLRYCAIYVNEIKVLDMKMTHFDTRNWYRNRVIINGSNITKVSEVQNNVIFCHIWLVIFIDTGFKSNLIKCIMDGRLSIHGYILLIILAQNISKIIFIKYLFCLFIVMVTNSKRNMCLMV